MLTCCDQYWLSHKKDSEGVSKLGLPLCVCIKDQLFPDDFQVAEWKARLRAWYMPEPPSFRPVPAPADHLKEQTCVELYVRVYGTCSDIAQLLTSSPSSNVRDATLRTSIAFHNRGLPGVVHLAKPAPES